MRKRDLNLYKLVVFLYLMVLVCPCTAAIPEKRVALVIGNSAYQHTPALINTRNDAKEIGKVLKRLGFDVDIRLDLTKQDMDSVLREFGDKMEGAHTALFYYAGHGIQVGGINYLIPVDAKLLKERDLYFEVSELNLVLRQMEGAQRVNLVFLDACRDNPMSKRLAEGMGSGRSAQIGRGLAPTKAGDGTLISYATKDGEVASDGKGNHSPYTQAILNHIETPLEISQLLRKVREDVKKLTDNRQVPWEYGSLTGDFYFTGPVTIQVQPGGDETIAEIRVETLFWESIMNDTNPAVFESYLKKYPNGSFADLARIRITDLQKESTKSSTETTPGGTLNPASTQSVTIPKEPDQQTKLHGEKPTLHTAAKKKYTKLGQNGVELSDSAQSWIMVRDYETGLIWEVKQKKNVGANYLRFRKIAL